MSEIVNLRRVRKERDRAAADAKAAENRRVFGRSKAEKQKAKAEAELAARRLEGHRRDDEADGA